ncbi:MAG: hypothetical protein KDC34_16540 [Saprospiraceae bacterium]|nr:hypothetical protein [Saprospiraceae bacterium]
MEEDWSLDFEWLRVRHLIKDQLGRKELPDLNAILFLVGVQELGRWKSRFTKEEKQDLMHVAICRLLSYDGYYAFKGRDADGWPHYDIIKPFSVKGIKDQSVVLKENIIRYFNEWEAENGISEEE